MKKVLYIFAVAAALSGCKSAGKKGSTVKRESQNEINLKLDWVDNGRYWSGDGYKMTLDNNDPDKGYLTTPTGTTFTLDCTQNGSNDIKCDAENVSFDARCYVGFPAPCMPGTLVMSNPSSSPSGTSGNTRTPDFKVGSYTLVTDENRSSVPPKYGTKFYFQGRSDNSCTVTPALFDLYLTDDMKSSYSDLLMEVNYGTWTSRGNEIYGRALICDNIGGKPGRKIQFKILPSGNLEFVSDGTTYEFKWYPY